MKRLLAIALVIAGAAAHAQQVYRPGDEGVALPVVVKSVKPYYTQEAMKQRIQGTVILECVVAEDGGVRDVAVTQSLDAEYGLDEQAIDALKQYQFKPGTKDAKAVAVRVDVEMKFTLK